MATTRPGSGVEAADGTPAPSASSNGSVPTTEPPSTSSDPNMEAMVEKAGMDDGSKLKTFLSILRRFIGVSDMAAVRFSLPAQLMEPIPNLEYWNYMDQPQAFVSIGESEDDLGRMLEVLRFWFTKDLKYVKNKPCKPYNSALGEFFRGSWEVKDDFPILTSTGPKQSAEGANISAKSVKVHYLTEQTSHHPPVSAYVYDCPEKGLEARGYDQLSAKFTGTSIKISPGQYNEGIYITLKRRNNEEYHLTHPSAALGGLLRGALSVSVADTCFITCAKTKIRTILKYDEEGWLGRSQNRVSGVVYRYDQDSEAIKRAKDVPSSAILAKLEGCWHEKIHYSLEGKKDKHLLLDLQPLVIAEKYCPPETEQLSNESRRYWSEVTAAIRSKQFGQATRVKQQLEETQRQKVAEREKKGTEWTPRFFQESLMPKAKPELSEEGRKAMAGMDANEFKLEE